MYAQHEAALVALTRSVLAQTDLSTLLGQAVSLTADTLALEYSMIWERLPDENALALRSEVGWQRGASQPLQLAIDDSPFLKAIVGSDSPIVVNDWPAETRFQQPSMLQLRGILASLYVAIPDGNRFFGVLGADVAANRLFRAEEIAFLEAVAHTIALAVRLEQQNRLVEQRVEERTHAIEQQLISAAQEKAVLEERQRLARDLHDSMTQALYGVTLHAQAARRLLAAGDTHTAASSLQAVQAAAQDVLDEMRLLIFDLRPPILEQAGLAAALQARLEAVEGRVNLQTKLLVDGMIDLPISVERALYRITQEALNNALKHAQARTITVHLAQQTTLFRLEINDDGIGFDLATIHTTKGMGLRSIAERVGQIGGTYTLRSSLGTGTQVCVEVPV
jgi:signal transduction histidine kinase